MQKGELEIKDDGEYKKVYPKGHRDKFIKPLGDEEYVIMEKLFDDAYEVNGKYGTFYSVRTEYKGEEVSFILDETEAKKYAAAGEAGDKIKVIANHEEGDDRVYVNLSFELHEEGESNPQSVPEDESQAEL